jgi:hypothetical protein
MKNNAKNAVIAKVAMGAGKKGQSVRAIDINTNTDITADITYMTLSKAFKASMWLENSSGKWRQIDPKDIHATLYLLYKPIKTR